MVIERRWKKWLYFYIPLSVFILFTLFPFYWMAVTAFRPDPELYRSWRAANATPFWTLEPTWSTSRACSRAPSSCSGCGTRC